MKRLIRKAIIALICMAMLFSACGSSSEPTTTTEAAVATTEEKTAEVTTKEETTEAVTEQTTEAITETETEPEPEIIQITLDNWSTYFSWETRYGIAERDAHGKASELAYYTGLYLKPEYFDKLISIKGLMGYEYESIPHFVVSIDKETGTIEFGETEKEIREEPFDDLEVSLTEEFEYTKDSSWENVTELCILGVGGRYYTETLSGDIVSSSLHVYDDEEEVEQWVFYPDEVELVRIEVELVLSK